MSEPQETSFDRLVKLLRQRRSIAMVGAGVSVGAGYPTWTGLLNLLHEKLLSVPQSPDMKRRGGLLPTPKYILQLKEIDDATWRAEEYRRLLGPTGFNSVIWETFRTKSGSTPSANSTTPSTLDELARLNFRHILTTNYDPCLENEVNSGEDKMVVLEWTDRSGIREFIRDMSHGQSKRHFIYVHGTYSSPGSIVLTERDYVDRYVLNEEANRKLLAIFMTQPVVFIGFSMSDPALTYILRMVNAHLGPAFVDSEMKPTNAQHFAILPLKRGSDEGPEINKFRGKYGIEPVFYEFTEDHKELPLLLQRLRRAVESEGEQYREQRQVEKRAKTKKIKTDPYDPQKGKWGGLAQKNYCKLSASVSETDEAGWFLFELRVESTDPQRRPLKGDVTFYLHPTFTPDKLTVPVANGAAIYSSYTYGAFTVGASINRTTKLELDLSELPNVPPGFDDW